MKRMSCLLSILLPLIFFAAETGWAVTIDLTSGTTGTLFINQSFNETRGVDITIVGGTDLLVSSMSLAEFNILGTPTGIAGARIYESSTGTLLASADQLVVSGIDQSVTIPLSALLLSNQTYRAAFFISAGLSGGSGDFFDADPPGLSIGAYLDATGTVRVIQAYQIGNDAFPTNLNSFVPLITMEAEAVAPVPEPPGWLLLVVGMGGLTVVSRLRRSRDSWNRGV